MSKKRLKGSKIHETFDDFLANHPEIKLCKDSDGDIINIAPADPEVDIHSQTIINRVLGGQQSNILGKLTNSE